MEIWKKNVRNGISVERLDTVRISIYTKKTKSRHLILGEGVRFGFLQEHKTSKVREHG